MFTYLHTYMREAWDGMVKAGLINNTSGIRFPQNIALDEENKFNVLAKKDGEFYNLVRDMKCPLYIDRLQGGTYIEGYNYDFNLINEYREMLGDNFWGFQMHEWMTNYLSDRDKLKNNNCPEPWTEEKVRETIFKAFPYKYLFLEAMNAREMAEVGSVPELREYMAAMCKLFEKRQKYTEGMIIPADSGALALQLEIGLGAKRFMPEVGAQISNTRLQLAYSRGMSKAHKLPFGIYYEPWGGEPFSAALYQRDGKNEWNMANEDFPFKTEGSNGGSSRSLQKRIHYYAYLSGASFISEEWGMANTFYDWNDFELSPYGIVKRDFIRFTEKYADRGEFVSPIAVVLPENMLAVDVCFPKEDMYISYNLTGDDAEKYRPIKDVLKKLFCENTGKLGMECESWSLMNYTTPDAIDIVHEDKCGDYKYYVNLTGSEEFSKTHNCINVDEVAEVLDKELPCKVEGGLHYFVNRTKDGYYLTIMNNSGVNRNVYEGETYMKEADKTVKVTLKDNRRLSMLEGNCNIEADNGTCYVSVPAGGWFFGKF